MPWIALDPWMMPSARCSTSYTSSFIPPGSGSAPPYTFSCSCFCLINCHSFSTRLHVAFAFPLLDYSNPPHSFNIVTRELARLLPLHTLYIRSLAHLLTCSFAHLLTHSLTLAHSPKPQPLLHLQDPTPHTHCLLPTNLHPTSCRDRRFSTALFPSATPPTLASSTRAPLFRPSISPAHAGCAGNCFHAFLAIAVSTDEVSRRMPAALPGPSRTRWTLEPSPALALPGSPRYKLADHVCDPCQISRLH